MAMLKQELIEQEAINKAIKEELIMQRAIIENEQ